MRPPLRPDSTQLTRVADAGLAFVLVVVAVSAAIRLNAAGGWAGSLLSEGQVHALRVVHRIAATLEVVAAAWAFWLLARRRAWIPAAALLVLTAGLAALGIVAGQGPSPLQALGNVAGGLALASTFGWVSGAARGEGRRMLPAIATIGLALLAVQVVVGARLSIFDRFAMPALPLHAYVGLGIAAWLVSARRTLLTVLAVAAPLAGFSALHYEYSGGAALVHALTAALLVAAAARLLGESA